MDYHIDKRVSLSTDSEYESLYSWSLQELESDGLKVGRDQIPWPWTLYFTATELVLSDALEIAPNFRSDEERNVVRTREVIRAKLVPGFRNDVRSGQTTYSMFGTDRTISNIEFFIEQLASEDEEESCTARGSVSYTFDNDFRDETADDTIVFHLSVKPETYTKYAGKIEAGAIDEVVLRIGKVDGFYSDWSPAITTNSIKVLTSHREHVVEEAKNTDIVPPRLGKVGEVELTLRRIRRLEAQPGAENDRRSEDEGASTTSMNGVSALHNQAFSNDRIISLLSSQRVATWLVAALLLLLLLR